MDYLVVREFDLVILLPHYGVVLSPCPILILHLTISNSQFISLRTYTAEHSPYIHIVLQHILIAVKVLVYRPHTHTITHMPRIGHLSDCYLNHQNLGTIDESTVLSV